MRDVRARGNLRGGGIPAMVRQRSVDGGGGVVYARGRTGGSCGRVVDAARAGAPTSVAAIYRGRRGGFRDNLVFGFERRGCGGFGRGFGRRGVGVNFDGVFVRHGPLR